MSEKELEHAKILKARKEIETIESKEELEYEAKLKERLDALQRKWENRLKKKSDAKIKAERLTKDGIVKDVLYILGLKDDFDKCENLASFDMIRERIKNEITFLKEFHNLNCDVEEIVVPNIESETDGKALLENSETPESSEDPVSETVEMKETEKSGPEEN